MILLNLGDEVLREVSDEETAAGLWKKLASIYLKKSFGKQVISEEKVIHTSNG